MFWQEETNIETFVVPEAIVDLLFTIDAPTLALDHAYHLSQALAEALPWFVEEERAALHLIHGADSGNGWERPSQEGALLHLSRRTKLTLRLPFERIEEARALSGQTLQVGAHAMQVGEAKVRRLATTTSLYARHVVSGEGESEGEFLQRLVAQMRALGVVVKKAVSGKEVGFAFPQGNVTTRSLMLTHLTIEDAVTLQERGVGSSAEQKRGFGLFIPHKSV